MITAIEPNVSLTGRYSITETANLLGIHRNTLRKYTMDNLIRCSYRRGTFRPFYTGREILRFFKAEV